MNGFTRTPVTWASYLALAFYAAANSALNVSMPFVRQEFHLNYVSTASFISNMALGILSAGLLGDRLIGLWGRRKFILTAIALTGFTMASIAISRLPVLILLGCFGIGFFGSSAQLVVLVILPAAHPTRSSTAIGESYVAASAATTALPLIGGLLITVIGDWRAVMALNSLLLLALTIICVKIPFPEVSSRPLSQMQELQPRTPQRFTHILIAAFLLVGVESSMGFWTPDFLHRVGGFSISQAAMFLSVYFSAILTGRIIGTYLTRWFSAQVLLFASILVAMIGLLLYWLSPWAWVRISGLFICGWGVGNHFPIILSFAIRQTGANSEIVSARIVLMAGLAVLCSPLLFGSTADKVGIFISMGLAVIMLLGAIGALKFAEPGRKMINKGEEQA